MSSLNEERTPEKDLIGAEAILTAANQVTLEKHITDASSDKVEASLVEIQTSEEPLTKKPRLETQVINGKNESEEIGELTATEHGVHELIIPNHASLSDNTPIPSISIDSLVQSASTNSPVQSSSIDPSVQSTSIDPSVQNMHSESHNDILLDDADLIEVSDVESIHEDSAQEEDEEPTNGSPEIISDLSPRQTNGGQPIYPYPEPRPSFPPPVRTLPYVPIKKTNRLALMYDKPRYYHMIMQLNELRNNPHETVTVVELSEISRLVKDPTISQSHFDHLNICIEYNDQFESNLKRFMDFIEENTSAFDKFTEVNYHIQFAPDKKWKDDYTLYEKAEYKRFIEVLNWAFGPKIKHCSIINKYDMDTVYVTERNELTKLGQEIQDDIIHWKNLRVLDYGESSIRFLPGVKFPDTLEVLNIGGGYALETLTGFKIPQKLRTLLASQNAVHTIDNVTFPLTLERLELSDNKIYFLNQVDFPPRLEHLDVSQNRIESLRGVNFPASLKSLNLGFNPIESIKGVKFPEGLLHLDVSNMPNESMTGVKFPELLEVLNLQASMTNTRGLKLPNTLSRVIMADNGVNSINPLKLPNSLEVLYLNNNNIKTLNKVQFPTHLKELYLGDNLITTLKNVVFPPTLEILDLEMDPDYDEQEKHITTLKDVIFPPNLKILKLGYHSIRILEGVDFPISLISLSLSYNDLRTIKNVRLGNRLKTLDLSGNQELTNIDQFIIPESVSELRIPPELLYHLPAYIVERANKKQLLLKKSLPY